MRTIFIIVLIGLLFGCNSNPTPDQTETATLSETPSLTLVRTETATPSATPPPILVDTETATPSATSTLIPSITPTIPTPTPYTPLVQSFWLVDADQDAIDSEIIHSMLINLWEYGFRSINIEVRTSPSRIGSMLLVLSSIAGVSHRQVENGYPYTLFGDNGNGDYSGRAIVPGYYALTVTAYTGANLTGYTVGSLTIRFSIVDVDMTQMYIMPCYQSPISLYTPPPPSAYFCSLRWAWSEECCDPA